MLKPVSALGSCVLPEEPCVVSKLKTGSFTMKLEFLRGPTWFSSACCHAQNVTSCLMVPDTWGVPGGTSAWKKKPVCQCRRFDPWVGKIPWSRKWQLVSVFLPRKIPQTEEPGGLRPWGCKARHDWAPVSSSVRRVGRNSLGLIQRFHLKLHVSQIIHLSASEVKWSEAAQSCPTLLDPMDCSPPGSSVHGILQARILEWVDISFSKGSSRPRDWTEISRIAGRRFNLWATREAQVPLNSLLTNGN